MKLWVVGRFVERRYEWLAVNETRLEYVDRIDSATKFTSLEDATDWLHTGGDELPFDVAQAFAERWER